MAMSRLDWLERELEREDLDNATRTAYETEADRLAANLSNRQMAAKAKAIQQKERSEFLRNQLIAGNLDVVDTFGMEEFGSDYEIATEGPEHIVYSKVAGELQENRHVFSTKDGADSKLRKLVWDRMYSKYVRTGELGSVFDMKQ